MELVTATAVRGQFGFLLSHMLRHASIADHERIVIDLGANDGFQGSHSFNLTQARLVGGARRGEPTTRS